MTDNPSSTPLGAEPTPGGDSAPGSTPSNAPEAASFSHAHDARVESSPKMEAASEDVRSQFASAGEDQKHAEQTIESLRANLKKLEQLRAPKAETHYRIDDPSIRQEVDGQTDQAMVAQMQEIQRKIAEKEKDQRREAYMKRLEEPDPDQGPDEEPGPELVE